MLELSPEALLDALSATPRQGLRQDRGHYLPEDQDDEGWQLGEEEYLADDLDVPRSADAPEMVFAEEADEMLEEYATPDQVVSSIGRVYGEGAALDGPRVEVWLDHTVLLYALMRQWRSSAQHDNARALENRLTWLQELCEYLVHYQQDFFLQRGPLKPLTQEAVASALWSGEEVRTRTARISRLVKGKGLLAPWEEVIPLDMLMPHVLDLRQQILEVLKEHDIVKYQEGRIIVEDLIPVESHKGHSIVKELKKRLQSDTGLSPRNIKKAMQEYNIPRVAGERQAAYEDGTAWWMEIGRCTP